MARPFQSDEKDLPLRIPAHARPPRPPKLEPASRDARHLVHEPLVAGQLTALQGLPDEGPLAVTGTDL